MRSQWLTAIEGVMSGILSAVIALLSFLPGRTRATPGSFPKEWDEFERSCPGVTPEDVKKFASACRAQLEGNYAYARRLYNRLLKRYPDNPVIHHNLRMMQNAHG